MTADEQACRDALRAAEGVAEGPIERHSERVFLLAGKLARGREIDAELLRCAAYLHDIGLFDAVATKAAYVTDGRRVTEELLAHWEPERLRRCADAVELHHTLRSQEARGLEVELLRVADRIEVSQGLLRAGLPRAEVRAIRREVPVDGFVGAVARGLARAAVRRPRSLPRIFFPR
jgi:hypothetical protein